MLTWRNTGDPCAPETLTFVNHLMPTRVGYTTALGPSVFVYNNSEITSTVDTQYSPRGLCYMDSSGDQQFVFSVAKKLYRHPNNTDVSRGVAYTNGNFSFAQWRDRIYACNGADALQVSTTGAFADAAATAPKLTRICTWNGKLAGINNVASFTAGGTPYAASNYRFWISSIYNPESFDMAAGYTDAYTQDIVDDGGPLVACFVLRGSLVLLKRSGVYMVDDTGDIANPYPYRLISDYFGCEWPDSVIVVNNIAYWISPTRRGEVVAFDGATVQVVSSDLKSVMLDAISSDPDYGFATISSASPQTFGGITAATDGETVAWCRLIETSAVSGITSGAVTQVLYLNVPTGRFGYSQLNLAINASPFGMFSSSKQNMMLTLMPTKLSAGDNRFRVAYMKQQSNSGGYALFYRGDVTQSSVKNVTPYFDEYTYKDPTLISPITGMPPMGSGTAFPYPATLATPTLYWVSSQKSGEAYSKPESASLSQPVGSWNSTTNSFDIPPSTGRSASARVFMMQMFIQPANSITSIIVDRGQSGTQQAGTKAKQWQ